jgi:Peptidase family M23
MCESYDPTPNDQQQLTNNQPMFPFRQLFTIGVVLFSAAHAVSQQPFIKVSHEFTPQGNIVFHCDHSGFGNYTVKVEFSELSGGIADVGLPFYGTVSTGRTRLFTIRPQDQNVRPRFNYSFRFAAGCLTVKPDTALPYLLPVSPGKRANVGTLKYIGETLGSGEAPPNWNALLFKMESCDTVFATRRGTVTDIRADAVIKGSSLAFDRKDNFINIAHDDCTIGYYSVLKEVFVKPGQTVQAGMPIGIAGGDDYTAGAHTRFSVSYSDVKNILDVPNSKGNSRFMPLLFWTKEGPQRIFQSGQLYTSDHPEALIIKEMTKQELKKRKQVAKP